VRAGWNHRQRILGMGMIPMLLKSSEAVARLGVSTTTLHRWIEAGGVEHNFSGRNRPRIKV
jgi:hypothetical protein